MSTLETSYFGYPLVEGYVIQTDPTLQRTALQSGWFRQRRTYLHNASQVTLSWRLRIRQGKELLDWLMAQPEQDFFTCEILSGNDTSQPGCIYPVQLRRTSGVTAVRIPNKDQFTITFQAETQELTGYQALATFAEDLPPQPYPDNLPLPRGTEFSALHGSRNTTVYSLVYNMKTEMLADWLAFSGYIGTAWFLHPMISLNVPCGFELIRYISIPSQTLIGPDNWNVSVQAETMPAYSLLTLPDAPVVGDCLYNSDIEYNDFEESYDCDGGVIPPQGDFTMPAGTVFVNDTKSGPSPLTATALLKFMRDGTVIASPGAVPAWPTWHTAPQTLPAPAVSFSQVVEISKNNGATWFFSTPLPGGTWFALKDQDVWIRLTRTSTYDISDVITLICDFQADQIPTPAQFAYASVELAVVLNVDDPTGVVTGATFGDGYVYTFDPGDTVESVSAGVTFWPDGRVIGQSTNQLLGLWFDPQTSNAGSNLWIVLTGAGSGSGPVAQQSFPPTGVRLQMNVPLSFTAIAGATGGGSFASVNWTGTYQVYNASTGGTLLGSGSIELNSEVSQ